MAGQLDQKYPGIQGNITLICALRDLNVPKFLSFDLLSFGRIITDLHCPAQVPNVDYGDFQKQSTRSSGRLRCRLSQAS